MSRKHNVKHFRKRSHYPERLRARGFSRTPVMRTLGELRSMQGVNRTPDIQARYENEKD